MHATSGGGKNAKR